MKIDPNDLPRTANIHYRGNKLYSELPRYRGGLGYCHDTIWKEQNLPSISVRQKTPEYLAAGKPVISTSITDVVNPYAHNDLVYIADTADEFINAAAYELSKSPAQTRAWLNSVDAFLKCVVG